MPLVCRRLVAVLCVAAVLLAGASPAGSYVAICVLAPVDLLFGLVIVEHTTPPDDIPVATAPVLAVRSPRAPPSA
jgi:hypothetical protein